jgi:DNA-binding transcriptional regulator YiaG
MTCQKCGEHILRHADIEKLDEAIKESLTQFTRTLINGILERERCTQEQLASRIGVTPEHLSNMKIGAKIPGFQTFNFLKTLYLDKIAFDKADPEINVGQLKAANG